MEEVIKFLKENRIGFLASVDNGKLKVCEWRGEYVERV